MWILLVMGCFQAPLSSVIIGTVTFSTWVPPRADPHQRTRGQVVRRRPQVAQGRKWGKHEGKRNFNKVCMNKLATTMGN